MLLRASYFGSIVLLVSVMESRDMARVGRQTTCRGPVKCAGRAPSSSYGADRRLAWPLAKSPHLAEPVARSVKGAH